MSNTTLDLGVDFLGYSALTAGSVAFSEMCRTKVATKRSYLGLPTYFLCLTVSCLVYNIVVYLINGGNIDAFDWLNNFFTAVVMAMVIAGSEKVLGAGEDKFKELRTTGFVNKYVMPGLAGGIGLSIAAGLKPEMMFPAFDF
jgi:hypothetical protein